LSSPLKAITNNSKKAKSVKNRFKIALIALSVAAWVGSAYAIPMELTLFDGTTTVSVTDGGTGDSNPLAGVITWIGSIGNWTINVSTAISDKPTGVSYMDVNSVNASSSAGGTLTITLQDGPFNEVGGVSTEIGGTTTGTVTYSTSFTGPITYGPGAFSGTDSGAVAADPYDMMQTIVINHTGKGLSSFDATVSVPDGGLTVAFLGFAVMGVEGLRRRLSR